MPPPSSSSSSTSSTLTSVPSRPHFDRPAHNDQGYFEPTLSSTITNSSHLNSVSNAVAASQSASTVAAVAAVREFSRKKSQNDLPPVSPPHTATNFSSAAGAAALAVMPKADKLGEGREKKESKMKLFSKPARLGGSASSSKQHLLGNADGSSANTSTASLASSVASKPIPSPSKMSHIAPQSVLSRLPAAVTGEGSRRPSFTQSISDNATMYSSSPPSTSSHTHHKHQFLLRRGKDKDLLSSASSNSKPTTSDGSTLYSFGPSSPSNSAFSSVTAVASTGGQKGYDLKHVVTGGSGNKDVQEQVYEDAWPLIRSRVLPLFLGAGLGTPVEDLNKLLQLHIRRQVDRKTAINLIEDTRVLLDMGMQSLDNALGRLPDEKLIPRLVEIWGFVFGTVLPYFEAVFLPLQQEFKGSGCVMSSREAREVWGETEERLDIRRMCLISYRDNIILPLHSRLRMIFSKLQLDFDVLTNVTETVARVLQCVSVLASVLSNDDKQAKMDELAKSLKHNWLSRGRTGRNRRGFVGTKTKRINSGILSTTS